MMMSESSDIGSLVLLLINSPDGPPLFSDPVGTCSLRGMGERRDLDARNGSNGSVRRELLEEHRKELH